MAKRKGALLIVSGPSGVGKNTLVNRILQVEKNVHQMPTVTTRAPRNSEKEGREHFFVTEAVFDAHVRDQAFLEWEWIHGNRYGTLRSTVDSLLAAGKICIADVDVKGALNLKQEHPFGVIVVFVLPPSPDVLRKRILMRGPVSNEELAMRIDRAAIEIAQAGKCDYQLVNDDLDAAVAALLGIVRKLRGKGARFGPLQVRFKQQKQVLASRRLDLRSNKS